MAILAEAGEADYCSKLCGSGPRLLWFERLAKQILLLFRPGPLSRCFERLAEQITVFIYMVLDRFYYALEGLHSDFYSSVTS